MSGLLNKKIKKGVTQTIFIFALSVFLISPGGNSSRNVLAIPESARGQQNNSATNSDNADNEEAIDELEEKAKKYRDLIDLKQQQQKTLSNQLELIEIQTDNFSNDIRLTEKNIQQKTEDVNLVEREISQREKVLEQTKKNLKEALKIYYQLDKESLFHLLSPKEDGLTESLNQAEYLNQTSSKINKQLTEIALQKKALEEERGTHKKKKDELEGKKQDLNEKVFYLNNEKLSKEVLLDKTQGEEAKYQDLLSRVEAQKKELIGGRESFSGESLAIIKNSPKPKSGLASNSWYYAQDDDRWGYKRIGLSSSLLKDYGCAISAVSMVFTYHKEKITPGELSSESIYDRDLIVWPKEWPKERKKKLTLISDQAHGNINWSQVDRELAQKNPVIVFIRSSTGAGHYVVIHSKDDRGKYVVHDPLFGANIFLETSKKLVSAVYNTSSEIDQMIIYKKK
ncbi:MAG TPA: hypothetical protein GX706_02930 [Candidatus Moranbacteria bacterium]|nr:hypothetical protein [Candidatus Moranbacteria bacterium]